MTEDSHAEQIDAQTDEETIDEGRRFSLGAIAAGGAALLFGFGASSKPAEARVGMPTIQSKTNNIAIENKQSTKIGREYTYIFTLTNKASRARRLKIHGKGPLDVYVPRDMGAGQSHRIVLQARRPLNRIIITN